MAAYKGKAPCAGCKKTVQEGAYRYYKDDLCYNCEQALAAGQVLMQQAELDAKGFHQIHFKRFAMEDYYEGNNGLGKWERGEEFGRALKAMLVAVQDMVPKATGKSKHYGSTSNGRDISVVFRHDKFKQVVAVLEIVHDAFAEMLQLKKAINGTIDERVREAKDRIWEAGVKKGQDMLGQLAKGEITLDEINGIPPRRMG